MLRLQFSVFGVPQLSRALSRFGEGISDFRPVFRQFQTDFFAIEREQFQTAGARGGGTWPPLSPTYAAWKAKHAAGAPLLVLSGEMKTQLTTGKGMVQTMAPRMMRLHPTVQRADWHQRGAGSLPTRRIILLTPGDRVRWVKMLQFYVYNLLRKGGLSR